MTCIVGVVHEGQVHLAADSAGVNGNSLELSIRKDEKIFRNGPYLIGFTSSFRMGQLLQFALKVPKRDPDVSAYEHMITTFIPAVRHCFHEGGFVWKEAEMVFGGTFLVGYDGHLFQVQDNFQVMESRFPYDACGCGAQVALGSLFATQKAEMSPHERFDLALEAATNFSAGVRAPFRMMSDTSEKSEPVRRSAEFMWEPVA